MKSHEPPSRPETTRLFFSRGVCPKRKKQTSSSSRPSPSTHTSRPPGWRLLIAYSASVRPTVPHLPAANCRIDHNACLQFNRSVADSVFAERSHSTKFPKRSAPPETSSRVSPFSLDTLYKRNTNPSQSKSIYSHDFASTTPSRRRITYRHVVGFIDFKCVT